MRGITMRMLGAGLPKGGPGGVEHLRKSLEGATDDNFTRSPSGTTGAGCSGGAGKTSGSPEQRADDIWTKEGSTLTGAGCSVGAAARRAALTCRSTLTGAGVVREIT